MLAKKLRFAEVMDIYGFRVIVNNIPACYAALGALHNLYHPKPGRFKDYTPFRKVTATKVCTRPFGRPLRFADRSANPYA